MFCFRTSPRKAWRYAEVEYANAGSSYGALALDCDDADAYARGFLRSEIPPPNWRVFRPDTGHSHAVWTLAAPVHKYPKARRGPLDYLTAIAEFYALTLGADPGYNGVLVHNPVSTPYETRWGPELPYPLEQLARVIPFGWRAPDVRQTGVGRNCDLFRAGMAWAGREANAASTCLPRCSSSISDSRIRSRCRKCEPRRGASTSTASGGRREAGTLRVLVEPHAPRLRLQLVECRLCLRDLELQGLLRLEQVLVRGSTALTTITRSARKSRHSSSRSPRSCP